MTVLTLGLNHHTAAVDLRGRFAFAVDQLAPALKHLHERLTGSPQSAQPEVALLSTCNRTELYCAARGVGASPDALPHVAVDWLAHIRRLRPAQLLRHTPLPGNT